MKVLIVVDMQNDFVTGALRNEDAIRIVPDVVKKVKSEKEKGTRILFTRDTHQQNYLSTEEGKNLPVEHCIEGTKGWEIIDELAGLARETIDKPTFGSVELGNALQRINQEEEISEVELIGICTDICVISNALLSKAFLPDAHIKVCAACCAGVTEESHRTALEAMKACHVEIV